LQKANVGASGEIRAPATQLFEPVVTEPVIDVGLFQPDTQGLSRDVQLVANPGHGFATRSERVDRFDPKRAWLTSVTLRHQFILLGSLDPKH